MEKRGNSQIFTEEQWKKVLEGEEGMRNLDEDRLRCSAICGLPAHLRGSLWCVLSRARTLSACFSDQVYCRLMLTNTQDIDSSILRDVYRTFPSQDLFRDEGGYGQRGLYNVLKAYSAYDPEIAYCQGMGFIVGLLLTELYSEEDVFWVFVQIMHSFNWRSVFMCTTCRTGTPKLLTMMQTLEWEVSRRLPAVYSHLQREEVSLDVPFTPFMMTIFACGTPHDLAVRVMDVFLVEGESLLYSLVVRLLSAKQAHILTLRGDVTATQALYTYLKHRLVVECCEQCPLATLLGPF